MSSLYLYDDYRISGLGASPKISEVVGGQQCLTTDASKLIQALLSNKKATLSGSMSAATGFALQPGYDPNADAYASLYYVAKEAPANATSTDLSKAQHVLVDLEAAQKNVEGTPTDIAVVVAKNATVAKALSGPGASLALLKPISALSGTEEKSGIKPAAILGALVGGGVGFVMGGPVGAVIGAIGTGVLVQQVA